MTLGGRSLLNFASNDYLGLAGDARLAEAAIAAVHTYGTGSTGSRLLSGQRPLHRELERAIADLKHTEDALVFSSGYLANVGTIAALVGAKDLILADQYNHSSLKTGAKLSGATVMDYPHNDMGVVRERLICDRSQYRRCLIVTDTVFSMDGDLCPLSELLDLADAFDSMVMVDDAHGMGVLGQRGSGSVEHLGCDGRPLIHMGTLSKALGSLGGYVAGAANLIDFLRNRAATWIYTTGLSPADTAAALAAIQIVHSEPDRRQRLQANGEYLRQGLATLDRDIPLEAAPGQSGSLDLKLLPSASPILCLQVKDAATVLAWGQALRDQGILVSAVRPPTTPTSRLRFTVMASHTPQQIDQLLAALQAIVRACHQLTVAS